MKPSAISAQFPSTCNGAKTTQKKHKELSIEAAMILINAEPDTFNIAVGGHAVTENLGLH